MGRDVDVAYLVRCLYTLYVTCRKLLEIHKRTFRPRITDVVIIIKVQITKFRFMNGRDEQNKNETRGCVMSVPVCV